MSRRILMVTTALVTLTGLAAPVLAADSVDEDWLAAAVAEMERSEYEVSPTSQGLQAPNREQNLRTYFREGAIEVVPRTDANEVEAWRFGWCTTAWGRAGRMVEIRTGSPKVEGSHVTYPGADISEWYENRAEGLEQGFTLHTRPPGQDPVRIEGTVDGGLGAVLRPDGTVDFIDANGVRVLNYGGLNVWDADGTELAAWLEVGSDVTGNSLVSIVVDDRAAPYPVTIDPILANLAWANTDGQANSFFGESLATAGDVNGDGYSDVIVGSRYDNGEVDEGRAYVFHGAASGLSLSPAWIYENNEEGSLLGHGVASAGDVNGDGYDDVIVGAARHGDRRGRVYLFHGSSSGLGATPDWIQDGPQNFSYFGWSLAGAGDVNGDGYADVIIGALQYDVTGGENEGRAVVYHGSAAGLEETPSWTVDGDDFRGQFGTSVSTAGDVNGDGYDDVIVGAYVQDNGETDEGRAYVYLGGLAGLSTAPVWTGEGDEEGAWYGYSVSTAGDVDGDGYAEIIVGAPHMHDDDSGQAHFYRGSASGPSVDWDWTYGNIGDGSEAGWSVATAGDINGDGFADVIIGSPQRNNGGVEGHVMIFTGSPAGLGYAADTYGSQAFARFGHCVATAGDVNGDGVSDVLVGSQLYDYGHPDQGRAELYLGEADLLYADANWTVTGPPSGTFGQATASAGDVNGDGYSDVIVGAPYIDNGEYNEGKAFVYLGSDDGIGSTPDWSVESNQADARLGVAVDTAGDVDGDGYADVIIGASNYTNGQTEEGMAFLYRGSAAGLEATPSWSTESDQEGAKLGISVATAGDVNGDGYADVVVGAYSYDAHEGNEGRAYAFYGSPSGLSSTPDWIVDSGQAGAVLGVSVASAGDVNGDGYSDIVVGASGFDGVWVDGGIVFVFTGSAEGLEETASWFAVGDQPDARIGYAVASAGDVNGDGYSDVIEGSYFTNGSRGGARVYLGSDNGPSPNPDWSVYASEVSWYGFSVATAGDVNGDGYSDFVVGAPSRYTGYAGGGAVYLYLGSPIALSTTPAWLDEGDADHAALGWSVAGAGDVNGDGFADLIVGRPGEPHEGAIVVYPGSGGNGGAGRLRLPRQERTDGSAPVALLGRSDAPDGFHVTMDGSSPGGRSRVRLELEVKPAGVPFDGLGTMATSPVDAGIAGVTLAHLVTGLQEGDPYRWRARIIDDSPLFPHSRWMSIPGNGLTEWDLRSGTVVVAATDPAPTNGAAIALAPPRPNPSAGTAELRLSLPSPAAVRLAIYDLAGRRVALVTDGSYPAGVHALRWDGRGDTGQHVAAGTYFARLTVGDRTETRKIVRVP